MTTARQWPLHWLTLLPVLVAVLVFHRDVPYHDQWDLLPLLDAYYRGQLGWHDLLAPHNGHILLLPRLIMLALAITTHWHTLAEVGVSLLLGAINFAWCLLLARQVCGNALTTWQKTALGLLVFSLAQADNWLWGWQLQVPLCLTFVLAGMVALRCMRSPVLALATAAVCGFAASVSFGAGMVFWLAALPLVWARQRAGLLPWLAAAAVCAGLYLHWLGATAPLAHVDNDPGIAFYRNAIISIAANTLACLGSVAARFHPGAAMLAGLLAMGWLAALLRTTTAPLLCIPAPQRALLLALALFGIGAALLVALSRSGMGDEQMLTSRYTTLCLPFWVSLFILFFHQKQLLQTRSQARSGMAALAGVLLALVIVTSAYSLKDFQRLHNRLTRGELALSSPDSAEGQKALAIINPRHDPARAREEVRLLAHYQLSFYRPGIHHSNDNISH